MNSDFEELLKAFNESAVKYLVIGVLNVITDILKVRALVSPEGISVHERIK